VRLSTQSQPRTRAAELVLGTIQDYDFNQVRPFAVSLRRTGYAGDVVFFWNHVDRPSRAALRDSGIRLIHFLNLRGNYFSEEKRRRLDEFAARYHRVRRPFYRWGWFYFLCAAKQRYRLYLQFLRRHGKRYRRVLLTDVRDVYFQRPPFEGDPGHDLVFFEEHERHLLGNCPWNAQWLAHLLGAEALDRLGSRITLCAGTTLGTPDALIFYLERYLQTLQTAANLDYRLGDQAIHNSVVYEHLDDCPFSLLRCPNVRGPVYTIGNAVPEEDFRFSVLGELLYPDGRVAPVLHQYDRRPELTKILLDRIAA
jgi:hypothetical protein